VEDKMHCVTLIPGDGIGPEITEVARQCLEATGVKLKWEVVEAGSSVVDKYGTPLPSYVINSIRKNKVAWKGPITTPVGGGFRSVNVALRKMLDLYMCLRPYKYYPGVRSNYKNVNLVVVRENTEDLYAGIEFKEGKKETSEVIHYIERLKNVKISEDSAISIKPISAAASQRIVEAAFRYALKNGRRKVTAVHKANIMKYSDGLFSKVAREVAYRYAGQIEFEEKLVDNMCMQLVQKPELYDVMVLPNLYGDILSDLCAGLVGGLGVAAGANIGEDVALFEAVHGSAPKYKGQNKVNPTALLLAAGLMLDYLGEQAAAEKLDKAIAEVIREGKAVTYDLKPGKTEGVVGTREMGEAIKSKIK